MIVRVRFQQGPVITRRRGKNRHLALGLAALITPSALMACALGVWRIAADLNLAGRFAIANGIFSHWQVWIASAVVLQTLATALNRYGNTSPTDRASV